MKKGRENDQKIDVSIPRRKYYRGEWGPLFCPECNSELKEEGCTILLAVRTDKEDTEFITNLTGSHFCPSCPVVVFDEEQIEDAVILGMREEEDSAQYLIIGLVDLNSIPEEKKHLEMGTDENPIPLVEFLPDLNRTTVIKDKKIGRNNPCSCGSGKKYKKCCGR